MVNFEITKRQKLYEQNINMVCHNFYYLIHGRLYNEDKTRFRKFKFVEWFDIFDIMEFFDTDYYNEKLIKEYVNNIENSYLLNIQDFDDKKGLNDLYNYCNETIDYYNDMILKRW